MISIHASYFGDNFGDSLFVIQYVEYLQKKGIASNNIYLPFAGKRVRKYVNISNLSGLNAIKNSKYVIFIGGGYFGERKFQKTIWHVRFWIRHISVALLCILFRKKFIFLGVGAGPLSSRISRYLSKVVINKSDGFYARDIKSKQFLETLGLKSKVHLVADSLISYKNHYDPKKKQKIILLHLPLIEGMHDGVLPLLKEVYNIFNNEYKVIVANDFYKPGFNKISFEIASKIFSNVEYIEYENPQTFLKLLNTCEIVITVKLHVGILSLACGSKVLSTYVHEKTNRFYNQINLSEVCFDYFEINRNLSDINKVLQKIKENKIEYQIPNDIILKSKMNFNILDELLKQ